MTGHDWKLVDGRWTCMNCGHRPLWAAEKPRVGYEPFNIKWDRWTRSQPNPPEENWWVKSCEEYQAIQVMEE